MKNITLEELLEAGCHFGHQLTRQNPKARDFVYEVRDGVQIIDLGLTKKGLDEAAEYVKKLATDEGAYFLIVGTKKQAQSIILADVEKAKKDLKEKGVRDGLFTVTTRWIGGTFSNFEEVRKNCRKLKDIKTLMSDEFSKSKYTKKELLLMQRDAAKLESFYGGILDMDHLPSAIFVVDAHLEETAIKEASNNNVKVVGIVDTNADPTKVNFVIPANDDAVGSLKLLIGHIVDAWVEGRMGAKEVSEKNEKVEEKEVKSDTKEEKTEKKAEKKAPAKNTTKKETKEEKK